MPGGRGWGKRGTDHRGLPGPIRSLTPDPPRPSELHGDWYGKGRQLQAEARGGGVRKQSATKSLENVQHGRDSLTNQDRAMDGQEGWHQAYQTVALLPSLTTDARHGRQCPTVDTPHIISGHNERGRCDLGAAALKSPFRRSHTVNTVEGKEARMILVEIPCVMIPLRCDDTTNMTVEYSKV